MQFAYIFNQQKTSDSRFLLVVPTIVGAYGVSQNFAKILLPHRGRA